MVMNTAHEHTHTHDLWVSVKIYNDFTPQSRNIMNSVKSRENKKNAEKSMIAGMKYSVGSFWIGHYSYSTSVQRGERVVRYKYLGCIARRNQQGNGKNTQKLIQL